MPDTEPTWPDIDRRSGRDRRVKRHFVFNDRRTGFDRRKNHWFFGTLRDNRIALVSLLALLNVLSFLDGALTAFELVFGIAREGNPLFGNLIQTNGFVAAGFKVAVMLVVSVLIFRWRAHRRVLMLVPFALLLYTALIAYHLGSLSGLGWL